MGKTALRIASFHGNLDVVEVLLNADADVEIPDNDSFTPLYVASQEGHVDVVSALLAAGADVDRPQDDGATPLFVASEKGHADVAVVLIKAGADVESPIIESRATPIYIAAYGGHTEVITVLIEAGADVNKPKIDTFTPLVIASQEGQSQAVSALLRAGADPNMGINIGAMPLHFASITVGFESEKIAVDLLDAGAEIDAIAADGETPLLWAVFFGNIGTTRILLLKGADRTIKDNFGRAVTDKICDCEGFLQCRDGGCDQQGTVKAIRDLLIG